MKLVSYKKAGHDQLAVLADGMLLDMNAIHPDLPDNMSLFLKNYSDLFPIAKNCLLWIKDESVIMPKCFRVREVDLVSPVPAPASCRDGYAFRQHVEAARHNRGLAMTPEFDQYPVFYFTNHHAVNGPCAIICMPDHLEKPDYELEVAVVISKRGRNIPAEDADHYIAGLMIMNDFSARTLQDFSTAFGPWLVTTDELLEFEVPCKKGHTGRPWDLRMSATVNGVIRSQGNLSDMDWTFAELIERASYGTELIPGDVIGSGTVGTGCFLELNGTNKLNNPAYREEWLQEGDVVELSVERLGILSNFMVCEKSKYSLLKKKKMHFS